MRKRLMLAFILVVGVSISLVLALALQNVAREVNVFMMRGGMVGLDQLAEQLESYYQETGSWQGVDSLLGMRGRMRGQGNGQGQGMGAMMNATRLRLADAAGTVVYDTSGTAAGSFSAGDRAQAIGLKDPLGRSIGYLAAEGGLGNPNAANNLVTRLVNASLISAAIVLPLALILAFYLSSQLTRPVDQLKKAALLMASGDLGQRVPVRGKDELAMLGTSFNQMASSLQQASETRRAMTADIAHELRTPLAVQRAHLEALQDEIYPLTLENLQPVYDQNILLARLVEDLRTLALADAGELQLELTPLDLPPFARRVFERFLPQATLARVQLEFVDDTRNQADQVPVDGMRIEQVLNNLLSNALRHTPPEGKITCRLTVSDQRVLLSIADSGPGIPEEMLPRVFERFYRGDRSRSRDLGSTGLGLAIARQLVMAHGGELTVANQSTGGAVFTVSLLLAAQDEGKVVR